MNIKVHKDYSDELIQKVFVKEGLGTVKNKEEFCEIFKAAKEKICLVCENGLSTELLKALAMTSARKYVIVRELEEEKYQTLSELLIVREVSNISGNYAIIDGSKIIFFDKNLNFNLVSDVKVAQKASSLFIKEFWDNANFEYVGKKQVAAETTFDIAPIYSEGKFIIDDAFSGNLQTVLEQSTEAYYKGKAKIGTFEKICIKDIRNNEEVISNITHQELIYAPELSVDAVKNADGYFYLNFGVEGYSLSPEKQKNHYFAIGADSLNVGTKYKFYLKEKFANLVGKTCLDVKGNPLVVEENVVVSKNVSVDLNKERLILEATEDLREGMLQSIDSKIFDYEGFAKNVVFDIALNLKKKKFTQKAKIYTQYEQIVAGLEKFRKTAIEFCKQNDKKKFIEKLEELSIKFTTVAEYETIVEKLKNIVENINSYDRGEIDEDLQDVSKSNKKVKILDGYRKQDLNEDLPKYGVMYQDGDRYEYVLRDKKDLQESIRETKGKKVEFFLE